MGVSIVLPQRMLHALAAFALFLVGSLFTSAALGAGRQSLVLLEAAPLKTLVGDWSVRGDVRVAPQVMLGLSYDTSRQESDWSGVDDRSESMAADLFWYPLGMTTYPVIVGGGLRREIRTLHGSRAADRITGIPMTAAESEDRWVNEDRYLSLTQTVGYRFFGAEYAHAALTASVRFVLDELLHKESRTTEQDIHSLRADVDSPGRDRWARQILVHAGISFQ